MAVGALLMSNSTLGWDKLVWGLDIYYLMRYFDSWVVKTRLSHLAL